MNITVNSTALAQELRLINHVVSSKPALPILMNVLVRAADALQFYATDMEIGFSTSCQAMISEPGEITLPAKKLLDLVEQLPNADVQIVTDKTHVRVLCGAFKSRLQTLNAADYPIVPQIEGQTSTLPTTVLQHMIARVRYAISDRTKYMVNGALLTLTDTVMALVATDGKRLSLVTAAQQNAVASTAIIPTKTLDAITALFSSEQIEFSQSTRHLFFTSGDRVLISRMLDGVFPAYQRIIPRDTDKRATIDRAGLAAALRRVGLIADANQAVYFAFESGGLNITASSAETGDAYEHLAINYDGPALKVCINWEYVLDFLNASTGASVTCDFKEVTTPLLLSDGDSFVNVVMLMRG